MRQLQWFIFQRYIAAVKRDDQRAMRFWRWMGHVLDDRGQR